MGNPPRPFSSFPTQASAPVSSGKRSSRLERVRQLEQQVAGVFAGEVSVLADSSADPSCWQRKDLPGNASGPVTPDAPGWVPSGSAALDGCLPGARGFRRGSLVEWLVAEPGNGAGALALIVARQACAHGGTLVIIDPERRFYPPAAAAIGIDLQRFVLIHPHRPRDALWAWDQSLRCSAVKAVWGGLEAIDDRWFRRFQLAVEQSQTLGLLLRPAKYRGAPSWSELQLAVSARAAQPEENPSCQPGVSGVRDMLSEPAAGRWLSVELVRCRGAVRPAQSLGTSTPTVCLKLEERHGQLQVIEASDHETPTLHLVSELANPTSLRRSAGA